MVTSPQSANSNAPRVAMVLAGGIGLGAYEAGAYAALHDKMRLDWVAGSSVGAITAAVIAGSPAQERVDRLRSFWNTDERTAGTLQAMAPPRARHFQNWASVLQTRLLGSPGHFHPRLRLSPFAPFLSLYDLAPMRARLAGLVDFDRLNGGEVRVSVAMTDIESGEEIVVDTGRGDRVTMEHLFASCGFLPEFEPVEIDGRLFGDGGLSANAPVDAVLRDDDAADLVCFVVDLFARDGARPTSLEAAAERKNDLMFGNQTWQRLTGLGREQELRVRIAELAARLPSLAPGDTETARLAAAGRRAIEVLYLSYRTPREEAGPEKPFDLSPATIAQRWHAGLRDMEEALRVAGASRRRPGLRLHAIRLAENAADMVAAE